MSGDDENRFEPRPGAIRSDSPKAGKAKSFLTRAKKLARQHSNRPARGAARALRAPVAPWKIGLSTTRAIAELTPLTPTTAIATGSAPSHTQACNGPQVRAHDSAVTPTPTTNTASARARRRPRWATTL